MHVHLVSFDVPFPPNYGGVIDVYYKISELKKQGIDVSLHCFDYGRGTQNELNQICLNVFYYKRNLNPFQHFHFKPYIVKSRENNLLLKNLLQDNSPIIFEGLHTCGFISNPLLAKRKKLVRMHNIEHEYYGNLCSSASSLLKKIYYKIESIKLLLFEKIILHTDSVLAISKNDAKHLSKFHKNVIYIPAFHQFNNVTSKTGKSNYALYHGNLSVAENEKAALFLIEKVFNDINYNLIIAGYNPTKKLKHITAKARNIFLKSNINNEELNSLIENAQINVLPTFQSTGIKLKLINALYAGRFCIANHNMIDNTGLEELVIEANSESEFKKEILNLINSEFTNELVIKRKNILNKFFSNEANVCKIIDLLEN